MRKLLIIIIFLDLVSCHIDKSVNIKEKFYDPKDLSMLSLEQIDNFWINDSRKTIPIPLIHKLQFNIVCLKQAL